MVPILDQLINLSVTDNESYDKCKELACGVRERLALCKTTQADAVPAETAEAEAEA